MITLYEDCNIISSGGTDMFGDPLEPKPTPAKCRAKEKYQMVRNNAAQDVVSEIEFWFYPETEISLDNTIEYKSKEYQIISIQPKKNTIGEVTRQVVFV